jgi:thiol-disulfide isomerase/thioredoxin
MRKILLILIGFVAFATNINAQTLVSTDVEKKNVVLEEFTGIHCQYCPQGHAIAQALADENPGDVVLINIHAGSFAVPSASEPDFRTPFGDAIAGQSGLTGYPAGTVNRHLFDGLSQGSGTAMSRGSWTTAAGIVFLEDSPVNVGASTTYNEATRELTVNVELYYTSDSPEQSNFINVALTQSGIVGPQTGGGMGSNYIHNHMLRYLLTDQWGEEITTTTMGSFVEKTYVYTIPEDYIDVACIVEDCHVAVFVSESHQEIYSGTTVNAIDGTTLITASMSQPDESVLVGEASMTSTFNMNISNLLSTDENFVLSLSNENEPAGWSSNFEIAGETYEETATINLTAGVPVDFSINVVPDEATAIIKYTFSAQSESNPNAPAIVVDVYVMAGVIDLLVNNQGAWTGGVPADLQQDYFDGFEYAQMQNYTACDYKTFCMLGTEDKLSFVPNLYFNIAWTFPSFTDENVGYLTTFLDAGGFLFVAGQDVGWDTWESGGNGTPATQAFYSNYLMADYQGDGSTANNTVFPFTDDEYFGTMSDFSIVDIYGGNMYPDEISPINEAVSIFKYNDNDSKGAAVRATDGNFKVVYLGFDPSMATVEARNEIIKRTDEWFKESVGINENPTESFKMYPNPTKDILYISAPESKISIYNMFGNLMYETRSTSETTTISTSGFVSGSYIVRINNNAEVTSRRLIVY